MNLKKWIIRKITIRRLFKAYGKKLYQERIDFVSKHAKMEPAEIQTKPSRMSFRRIMVTSLVLVLIMASAIASAVKWEEKPPIFSFIEEEDHSEVHVKLDEGGECFLDIGYVPEGYEHVSTDKFHDISLDNTYKNEDDEYLYIRQDVSGEAIVNISNEDCERYVKKVNGIDVQIYDYNFGKKIWLFVKNNVYIRISGYLSTDEMQLIMESLEIPA